MSLEVNVTTKECANPALNVPPECRDSGEDKDPIDLVVTPKSGFVEVSKTFQFSAILKYSDGSTEDVTAQADWTSMSTDLATVGDTEANGGLVTGKSAGISTILAEYQGLVDSAEVEVSALCEDKAVDAIMVMDRSGSMFLRDGPTLQRRIDRARNAAKKFLESLDFTQDKAALITYAGIGFRTRLRQPFDQTIGEATLDHGLTNDQASLEKTIDDHYFIHTPCLFPDSNEGPNERCLTGFGAALEQAHNELKSARHKTGPKKVIIFFTDGINTVPDPDPVPIANTIKNDNVTIIVVSFLVSTTVPGTTTGESIATSGRFFNVQDPEVLGKVFAKMPNTICVGYYGTYGY